MKWEDARAGVGGLCLATCGWRGSGSGTFVGRIHEMLQLCSAKVNLAFKVWVDRFERGHREFICTDGVGLHLEAISQKCCLIINCVHKRRGTGRSCYCTDVCTHPLHSLHCRQPHTPSGTSQSAVNALTKETT